MNKLKNKHKNFIRAIKIVNKTLEYKVLLVSFFLNFLALDYIIFSASTTIRIFTSQNTAFYNWATLLLSVTISILFAISAVMLLYIIQNKKKNAGDSASTGFFGSLFAAIASGCPVCGAYLLPLFGIAGSLAVFPLQGLGIKILAILLLLFSIYQSTDVVLGLCKPENARRRSAITIFVLVAFIVILVALPYLPANMKVKFQKSGVSAPTLEQINLNSKLKNIYNQVNPKEGYTINAKYGNIGYQLVKSGAIDFDKFKKLYDQSGTPLTKEQLQVFTKEGLDKPIKIDRNNAYFLLNLFWAFGLTNNNPIITQGQITQYSNVPINSFASTGGWTIAKKPLEDFMAKLNLAPLSKKQQDLLQQVAENVYRPCCGNSTAFPDCNHGMALLGVLELMAANGASERELYDAAKYFSAFWFPSQMMDVATFFMVTENKDFKDVDPKLAVSAQLFSGQGWSGLKAWLDKNLNLGTKQLTPKGGGCGV